MAPKKEVRRRALIRSVGSAVFNNLRREARLEAAKTTPKPKVSSALSSQIFHKQFALDLLWLPAEASAAVTIKCCARVIHVSVKASANSNPSSQFVSMTEFINCLKADLNRKAKKLLESPLEVQQGSPYLWKVTGSQDTYTVNLEAQACNCKLFRCFQKRIFERPESLYLLKLLNEDEIFQGQATCHHLLAAKQKASEAGYFARWCGGFWRIWNLNQNAEHQPYTTTKRECDCGDWVFRKSKTGGRCKHQRWFYPELPESESKVNLVAFVPVLSNYRGWSATLVLLANGRYRVECSNLNGRGPRIATSESYRLREKQQAIAAARKLIDLELDFNPFQRSV